MCVQKYKVQICKALTLMQRIMQLVQVGIASNILLVVGIYQDA
jgi:hypothetical protein